MGKFCSGGMDGAHEVCREEEAPFYGHCRLCGKRDMSFPISAAMYEEGKIWVVIKVFNAKTMNEKEKGQEEKEEKIFKVHVHSGDLIEDVKKEIEKVEPQYPAARQRLILNGKAVEDGRTCADYGLESDTIIYLLLR